MQNHSTLGHSAPEFRIKSWIDANGDPTNVSLKEQLGKVVFLLCFQSWCPGCHSSGFPTLQKMQEVFAENIDVQLMAVQTVFEGFDVNSEEKVWEEQQKYGLNMPIGHDPGQDKSTIMEDYQTGGTPWIIIIDKKGFVQYSYFHIGEEEGIGIINGLINV